ncbi:MAG TPA: hypothetical protein PKV73_15500 [Agriterribacter sp.]|nr:hypothetical protein [Agriterribacter sp.]
MFSLFIIVAINIAASIITFVSTTEKIIDIECKGIKKIKKGGWILLAAFIATIILSITQYFKTKSDENKSILRSKSELHQRDSIAESKRLESNKQIVDALAKYHLSYVDSLKKVVKVLRDSSRNITNIISEDPVTIKLDYPPVILDSSDGIKRYFSIILKNFKGEAYNVNVQFKILKKIDNRYLPIISNMGTGIRNHSISENEQLGMMVGLYSSENAVIYFHVYGNYESFNKTKYTLDGYCGYNIDLKEGFILTAGQLDEVKDKFK